MLTISSRNLNLASTNLVSFGGWHDFITSQNELIGTSTFFRERKNNSQSITFKTYANRSLQSTCWNAAGIFPSKVKQEQAKVIPVYKSDDETEPGQLR